MMARVEENSVAVLWIPLFCIVMAHPSIAGAYAQSGRSDAEAVSVRAALEKVRAFAEAREFSPTAVNGTFGTDLYAVKPCESCLSVFVTNEATAPFIGRCAGTSRTRIALANGKMGLAPEDFSAMYVYDDTKLVNVNLHIALSSSYQYKIPDRIVGEVFVAPRWQRSIKRINGHTSVIEYRDTAQVNMGLRVIESRVCPGIHITVNSRNKPN